MWRRDVGVGGGDGRVRVLVESADPTLQIAEFRRYRDAGLDVTLCGGPVGNVRCPLVDGDECPLADSADVVLFGLDADGDVLAAHRAQHPSLPVVAEVRRDRPAPEGCTVLPFPSSVDEQIRVLRRTARPRSASR